MKKLLSIIFLLTSVSSFCQLHTLKVHGIPGVYNISKVGDSVIYYVAGVRYAFSVGSTQINSDWNASSGSAQILNKPTIPTNNNQLTNGANYITSSQAPVQSVAGKTGAVTLTKSDVGLSLADNTSDISKPVSTAVQTALNLKANDNVVAHLAANETVSNKWMNNSYVALGGEIVDLGMTGLYDRNELTNIDLRGTVTVNKFDSVAHTTTDISSSTKRLLFDGSANFSSISTRQGDSITVLIDYGSLVPLYSHGRWQPFVSYRVANYDYYKNISVWVSPDNTTWYQPATGWTCNNNFPFANGLWMGTEADAGVPGFAWRYAKFVFKNPYVPDAIAFISEIGIRHVSAPYARQYVLAAGDDIYGKLNLQNKSTTMGYIDAATGTFNGIFSGNASSATKLATPRAINGVNFDGTAPITITDATKEPIITAGTTSQFWRGDKTWQAFSTLPISTATQTALNAKLDTSYRDNWTTLDPQVSDTVNKTIGLRQSFVDSLRNGSFNSFLNGKSGGQTLYGGTASGNNLTLSSTSNATKGYINFGANSTYDETNNRLGINTLIPRDRIDINGAVGGSLTFGGGNGKTISAYQNGVLDAIWFNSVNTRFSGVLTIPSNDNGGNIWISKSDGSNTSYTEIGNTHSDQFYINVNGHDVFVSDGSGNAGFGAVQFPNSSVQTTSLSTQIRAIGSAYTAASDDHTINCVTGTFTVTLPTSIGIVGREYVIANSSTGTITIATTASQKFKNVLNTPTTLTLSGLGSYKVRASADSNWIVEALYQPPITKGTATLVAGTVTVSSTAVTATSKIFLTVNTPAGTRGFLSAPSASITAGTSFVINSSSATETSTVNWMIIN